MWRSSTFFVLVAHHAISLIQGSELNMDLLNEMERNPLSKNPFFATIIGGQFKDEGQEGIEPASSGYFCKMLGNLECSDYSMQCEGRGVIDCTGQCPGDISVLDDMFQKLESAEFMADYPLMAEMMNKTRENQGKESGGALKDVLVNCGFTKYLALLALKDGPGFGEATNNSVGVVDEDAVSGFGDYNYDYESEEETVDSQTMDDSEYSEPEAEAEFDDVTQSEDKDFVQSSRILQDQLFVEEEDLFPMSSSTTTSENEILKRNSPKRRTAFSEADEMAEKAVSRFGRMISQDRSSRHKKKDIDQDFNGAMKEMDTLEDELEEFRGLLKIALDDMVSPGRRDKRHLKQEDTVQKMKQILVGMDVQTRRYTRSLMENDTGEPEPETTKCIVRNLTCVRFPTLQECSGIAVGGCVTRSQALAILFAPRVIIVIVAVILILIVAIGGVAYYLYKRKRMNLVEPIEINGNNRPEGRDHSTDAKHKLVKQVPFNQSNPEVNLEPEQERDIQTQA